VEIALDGVARDWLAEQTLDLNANLSDT